MALLKKKITRESDDFEKIASINREAFPDNERMELTDMVANCRTIGGEVAGWYDGEDLVGYTMILENSECAYLDFFATIREKRSRGYGHQILKKLQEQYEGKQLLLDFEIVDPAVTDYSLRMRRKQFYLRNGFKETGMYVMLEKNYFELVCNEDCLNLLGAKDLFEKLHKASPEFSGHVFASDFSIIF